MKINISYILLRKNRYFLNVRAFIYLWSYVMFFMIISLADAHFIGDPFVEYSEKEIESEIKKHDKFIDDFREKINTEYSNGILKYPSGLMSCEANEFNNDDFFLQNSPYDAMVYYKGDIPYLLLLENKKITLKYIDENKIINLPDGKFLTEIESRILDLTEELVILNDKKKNIIKENKYNKKQIVDKICWLAKERNRLHSISEISESSCVVHLISAELPEDIVKKIKKLLDEAKSSIIYKQGQSVTNRDVLSSIIFLRTNASQFYDFSHNPNDIFIYGLNNRIIGASLNSSFYKKDELSYRLQYFFMKLKSYLLSNEDKKANIMEELLNFKNDENWPQNSLIKIKDNTVSKAYGKKNM